MKIARIVINVVLTAFLLIGWNVRVHFVSVAKEESVVYSDTIITKVHKDIYSVQTNFSTSNTPYYFLRSPDDTYFLVRDPNEELQTALTSAEGKTVRIGCYSTDYQYAGASEIVHIEIDGVKYLDTRETIEAERQKNLRYFAFEVGFAAIMVTVKIIFICTKPEC